MKVLFLATILFFFVQSVLAQNSAKHDSISKVFQSVPIKVSYWGDNLGVKPGFSVGVEHSFRSIVIEKTKNSGRKKLKTRDYFYSLNLAAYHHAGYNSALYFYPEIGLRKTKKCGFYSEFSMGTGLMHTTLSGPTYSVDNMGNVSKVNAAGSNSWAFNISPGWGWDFSKRNPNLQLKCFIKPSILFQYPYNGLYLKHVMVETGLSYSFSDFLYCPAKSIYRKINSSNRKK